MRCQRLPLLVSIPYLPVYALVFLSPFFLPHAYAQPAPYNPYADTQGILPPLAADGTIQWGTFYKSAAIQKAYERLWNLGACRGTNKAITIPVENNKLVIDTLPEEEFRGVVLGATGSIAGGMLMFVSGDVGHAAGDALAGEDDVTAKRAHVAVLHPAGVSHLFVSGNASPAILSPGLTVRIRTQVNAQGRAIKPVEMIDIITPLPELKSEEIHAGRPEIIVGRLVQVRNSLMLVQVDAGRIRRLSLPLAENVAITIESAQLELVGPGDSVEVKGRLWTGEGSMGAGTIFASKVTVHKAAPTVQSSRKPMAGKPAADAVGAR